MDREEFQRRNRESAAQATKDSQLNWFSSIEDLKARHKGQFFSRDAMRFFNSRVLPTLYGRGRVFVTSEREETSPRRYTIRIVQRSEGREDFTSIGDFQAFATSRQANALASLVGRLDRQGLLPDEFAYGQDAALAKALGIPESGRTDGWTFHVEHGFAKEDPQS